MTTLSKKLLDDCLEIEGLLALLIVRNGNCSQQAIDLLKMKTAALNDQIASLSIAPTESENLQSEPEDTAVDIPEETSAPISDTDRNGIAEHQSAIADVTSHEPTALNINTKFSINDKFLFCRELFNSSKDEMSEALEVIKTMSSREEVEDYLFNDLCLSPDNSVVTDFINALTSTPIR